jgi:hypothetical protein
MIIRMSPIDLDLIVILLRRRINWIRTDSPFSVSCDINWTPSSLNLSSSLPLLTSSNFVWQGFQPFLARSLLVLRNLQTKKWCNNEHTFKILGAPVKNHLCVIMYENERGKQGKFVLICACVCKFVRKKRIVRVKVCVCVWEREDWARKKSIWILRLTPSNLLKYYDCQKMWFIIQ